jgi:hypothetical protein
MGMLCGATIVKGVGMKPELRKAQEVFDAVRGLKDALKEVNVMRGVDGSMVITDDGMVVASVFGPGMLEEAVAAVASRFIVSTRQLVETLNFGRASRFLLRSKQGVFVLVPAGRAFLAVVGNASFESRTAQPHLTAAARKIAEMIKLRAPAPGAGGQ